MSQAGHWVTLGETVQRDIVVYFSKTGNEKLYKRLPMEKKKRLPMNRIKYFDFYFSFDYPEKKNLIFK